MSSRAASLPSDPRLAELEEEIERLRLNLAAERARNIGPEGGEAKFHAIADSIDQMIWSARPDGFHDYYNRRWYDYTGVPEGSTDGEAWNGMFHPDDREHAWSVWRGCLSSGDPYEIEYRLRHRSGAYRWVLGRAQPVRDQEGAIVRWYGTCTDIHDFKAAEAELRESQARLQTLTNNIPGVMIYQVVTSRDMSERRYVYVSDNAEHVVGVPAADAITDPTALMSRINPEEIERVLAAERDAAARMDTLDIELGGRTPRGDMRTRIISQPRLLDDGRLIWDGIVVDVTERRRQQDEAQRTASLLHAIGEATPDLIFAKDSDLRITYANAATCRTIGIPPERVIGVSNRELARDAAEAAAFNANDHAVMRSGVTQVIDEIFTSPDGTRRVYRSAKTPMRDAAGAVIGLAGVSSDISERVEAERLLRESEARLRFLSDLDEALRGSGDAPSAMYAAAGVLARRLETSRCAYAAVDADNDTFTIYKDYTAPGVTSSAGTYSLDLFGPRAVADMHGGQTLVIRDVAGELAAGEGREMFQAIGIDAIICRPLVKEGRLVAMMAVHQDRPRDWRCDEIDLVHAAVERCWAHVERVGAEARLRESEARLRLVQAAGGIGSFDYDLVEDRAICSPEYYAILGLPEGSEINRETWAAAIHPEDRATALEVLDSAIAARRPFDFEYRIVRADTGETRWLSGRAAVLFDAAGRPHRYVGGNIDVTDRRAAEEEVRKLNQSLEQRVAEEVERRAEAEEALRQAQKMETLGQLTGGVAHDFNNLLQIVSGNLDLLRRGLPEDAARLRRAADNAMRGAERAAILTQRLLAFSRRQPLAPKPVDVNKLVLGMSELLHRTLGEPVAVETTLASGLWGVEVDPNQLENALINLAVNARDAMPDGGKLTIETANTHLDRAYVAANAELPPGQYVAVCVSDTGCGMDQETVARAFEPFFTTKEVGKGTGLGLSMVYGFVKQSGGHLKIYSEPGEGTTVKIYLPRRFSAGPVAEPKPEASVPEAARDETILVCEDDEDVRAFTVEVLRELGYRVLEAEDGPAALRILGRAEARIDLLFTDVVLPSGMTGAMLAREAHALRPDLKVLFTTGYARSAIVHHGRLDPGVELITKPFAYADLAARVRDMIDGVGRSS